jgi:exonuclease VII small subunit
MNRTDPLYDQLSIVDHIKNLERSIENLEQKIARLEELVFTYKSGTWK